MSAKVALKNSLTSEPRSHFEDPAEEDVALSGVGWIPRNGVNGRSRIKSGGDVEEQQADNCKVHDIKVYQPYFIGRGSVKSPPNQKIVPRHKNIFWRGVHAFPSPE